MHVQVALDRPAGWRAAAHRRVAPGVVASGLQPPVGPRSIPSTAHPSRGAAPAPRDPAPRPGSAIRRSSWPARVIASPAGKAARARPRPSAPVHGRYEATGTVPDGNALRISRGAVHGRRRSRRRRLPLRSDPRGAACRGPRTARAPEAAARDEPRSRSASRRPPPIRRRAAAAAARAGTVAARLAPPRRQKTIRSGSAPAERHRSAKRPRPRHLRPAPRARRSRGSTLDQIRVARELTVRASSRPKKISTSGRATWVDRIRSVGS